MSMLTHCLVFTTVLVGAARVSAEPLTDLLVNVCSSVPGIATTNAVGNCSSRHGGLRVKLTASRIPRSKPLPPIALPDGRSLSLYHALVYNGSLTPEIWIVRPGDVLDVSLRNRLPPQRGKNLVHLTNLHTHGMLVRPDLVFAGDHVDPLNIQKLLAWAFVPQNRSGAGHVRSDRDRPDRQLIPGQQITRERQQQREHQ